MTEPAVPDRARDYLDLDGLFSAEELALRDRVRGFVDARVRPHIAHWYESATFPRELVKELGVLGLLGMHLQGYGCAGRSAVEYGLAAMELEAGDSGIRTLVSVQGSLAMTAIARFGSPEQKQRWLPGMATGDLIGCFGLTEPTAGSDPAGMTTRAVRDGDGWVLAGTKRWIGLASIADVAIIWAKADDNIRGFVVPTATAGFTATPIEPKLSLRASLQCDIALDGVRLPADAALPGAVGLKGPFSCLNEGPLRDHLGRHGRRPRLLRGSPAPRAAAPPVRPADRVVPAHPAQARRHGAGDPERRARRAAHRPPQGRREAPAGTDLLR
jgi:glutaryl-CoA dehydrogenase